MLEVLPEKTKVTLSVDANALLFMQRTFGKRGVGEKISELIFELQRLLVSYETVKTHGKHIRRKLGAKNRLQAARFAQWLGVR
jgi:hypothetical protein